MRRCKLLVLSLRLCGSWGNELCHKSGYILNSILTWIMIFAIWIPRSNCNRFDISNVENFFIVYKFLVIKKHSVSIFIPPTNYVCEGVYCFHVRPCVCRPSMTFWFFLNILKRQWWKFIKLCRHIDIDKMYFYNRKLRARGQFCWSYCPL